MPRIKVSYEVEATEIRPSLANSNERIIDRGAGQASLRIPEGTTIEEIEPPFVPGYYENPALVRVTWFSRVPPAPPWVRVNVTRVEKA